MRTSLIIVLVIIGLLYLGSGYFGAVMLTKLWKSSSQVKNKTANPEIDEGISEKPKESKSITLTICQCISILLGPTIPCTIICVLFLVYLFLGIINIIARCTKYTQQLTKKNE